MSMHSEGITDADLDRFEKVAEPVYRSTATAGEASRFQVSDLGMWVVRLVAEVRRLRTQLADPATGDDRDVEIRGGQSNWTEESGFVRVDYSAKMQELTDHFRSRLQGEIPDAQIEAAARALLPLLDPTWPYYDFDELFTERWGSGFREAVAAALRAAVSVGSGEPCQHIAEEPAWQYSYVERIGRHGDVHERVTFDSLASAQQYLRANAESVIDWNREVKKRDHKIAGVEKRHMTIGDWVPMEQVAEESAANAEIFARWQAGGGAEIAEGVLVKEPQWETTTGRGFGLTEFEFRDYGSTPIREFSVQRSSLATEHKVWVGVEPDRAHLNVEEATRVRDALNAFLAEVKQEAQER